MGSEIKVSIVADASQLGGGLSAATDQVQSAASKMAEAQQKATVATKALAEAQVQLGASAAAGNAQAQQILAQYTTEVSAAALAVEQLSAAEQQNAAAATSQAAAVNIATAVVGHSVPQFAAASGALRLLEGNFQNNIRAAERFLSTTLGLGPVLQAAFPVVGAIAMAGILVEIGSKISDFAEKASDLSNELDTNWLEAAIGQMTGLGKATEEADKQIEKFAADNDAAKNKLAEAAAVHARLQAEIANPGSKGSQEGAIAADNVRAAQLQKRIDALQSEKNLAAQAAANYGANAADEKKFEITKSIAGYMEGQQKSLRDQKLEEQSIAEYKSVELEQTALIAEKENLILNAQREQSKEKEKKPPADHIPAEIARAAIEAAHAMDSTLSPAQQITAELQKHLELNLANEQSSKQGTAAERERLRALQDETAIGKANAEVDRQVHEELIAFVDQQNKEQHEAARKTAEYDRKAAEDFKRNRSEQIALAKTAADDSIHAAEEQFQFTEREIRYEAELGIISAKVGAQRLVDAERLKEQQTTGALSKEQGLFDPALGQKELQEWTALENRMTQEARKGALERQQITQQETIKLVQQYQKVAAEFNRDFTVALDAWITKSQTVGQAFARMFGQLELQLVNFVAEWLLKKAEMWALDEILQATGLAKQKATQGAAAVAQVTSDASVAAAGTLAYYSAINPPAAPALAAAAFAETIAYAPSAGVFDTGGILPHMGFAFNSSGSVERVLSPSQTSNFESLVSNGGSRSATLNQTNHFGGGVTPAMLQDHTRQTMSALRSMVRPEALR